jgi:hypothetical protein
VGTTVPLIIIGAVRSILGHAPTEGKKLGLRLSTRSGKTRAGRDDLVRIRFLGPRSTAGPLSSRVPAVGIKRSL